ncbi:hypothetical protein [Arthrobacter sp. KK5.5]|uniref:hypothetical protein n=1 Tax=Arthrobacter sp. KK5.5 TaxID=3373084 RepID=UPI003EE5BCEF
MTEPCGIPTKLDDLGATGTVPPGKHHVRHEIRLDVYVDALVTARSSAEAIVCFLPSAQPVASPQANPVFHRWTWEESFLDAHVVVLSDPALYVSDNVHAGWFIDQDDDFVAHMAFVVAKVAKSLGVPLANVVTYGSSMGGYGALMLATELRDPVAVAEVPQLDLRKYSIQRALRVIEDRLLSQTIDELFKTAPERISVVERMKARGVVPRFKIVTNRLDAGHDELIDLQSSLKRATDFATSIGDYEIQTTSNAIGHKPLPRTKATLVIRSVLGSLLEINDVPAAKPASSSTTSSASGTQTFREVLDEATGVIASIRYIRDEADTAKYLRAKELLYRAAELNPAHDWPYRRLCSLIKLWKNTFDNEVLAAAENAFARGQSLESFIYCCRGYLSNFGSDVAGRRIEELIGETNDTQTANVGRIFLSVCAYEAGEFDEYADLIGQFQSHRADGFEPYIAIPVSTVVTASAAELTLDSDSTSILDADLSVDWAAPEGAKYIVSASCDEGYFHKYARFLVQSFSLTCSEEAVLHLAVISDNPTAVREALAAWDPQGVVLSVVSLDAGDNLGPIASLIRFSFVYPLLRKFVRPVVVLDLDTVITTGLSPLIEKHAAADICSRILGQGVAPWEKYTGGFAVFNPTAAAGQAAGFIAAAAAKTAVSGSKQWWIDQNCFEAGIRLASQDPRGISVTNVYTERDAFCVMPVGSGDAKLHVLERAMKTVLITAKTN